LVNAVLLAVGQVIWHDASHSQWQEYVLKGCHLDIRAQIEKSRRESMRMLMESIVPKY